jgi:hypothetical protein
MYNLPLKEELEEYLKRCEVYYLCELQDNNEHTANFYYTKIQECKNLLTLYNERKLSLSDWQEIKKIAEINRMNRVMNNER